MLGSIKGMTVSTTGSAMAWAIKSRHVPVDMDIFQFIFVGIFLTSEKCKDGDNLGKQKNLDSTSGDFL